jgi:hypothetical protein
MQSMLGQLGGMLPKTGITGTQTNALNQIEQNAAGTSQFNPAISNVTSNLLAGGGALAQAPHAQAPQVQSAYNQFVNNTSPLANNTNYDPMQTPGLGAELQGLQNTIGTNINGQFAAAGRDLSPANSTALAYGLTQGMAPILTNQYNQNVSNQQAAANSLYQGGLGSAALLSGLQQQYLGNQAAGINSVSQGLNAQNAGPMASVAAEAQRFGIPAQNLGLLANIGIPIAGLGSESNGQSQTTTSQPWYAPLQSVGGLFSGGSNSAVSGMGTALGGLLSFL